MAFLENPVNYSDERSQRKFAGVCAPSYLSSSVAKVTINELSEAAGDAPDYPRYTDKHERVDDYRPRSLRTRQVDISFADGKAHSKS